MKVPGIITLTTDFGLQDPYVGMMKGVILTIHPHARLIDISHQIEAGAVAIAADIIHAAFPYFPKGTVHVAVIDPGVGGDRRPIVFEAEGHFFVGPDNGLFWPIMMAHKHKRIIHLTETKYFLFEVSQTFHGRDIFAPVAAHVSSGVNPSKMGPPISDPLPLKFETPYQQGGILYGQVIRVDHFGNLITNIRREDLAHLPGAGRPIIKIGRLTLDGVLGAYSQVNKGEVLALINSSNCLEIAVNLGRACDHPGLASEGVEGLSLEVSRPLGPRLNE